MITAQDLVRDLKGEFTALADDLRVRSESDPGTSGRLHAEYEQAVRHGRTAQVYEVWREGQITQGAAAWLLGCAFVRFCEDNRLIRPVWLVGPPERRGEAQHAQNTYFQRFPRNNDRDWLLEAFHHLAGLPATRVIFDERNPLWSLQPSADAAERMVRFWREADESGALLRDFGDSQFDTRFLGDLYQDLSDQARNNFALLQTPDFVAEFILDRTLERAIAESGLDGLKLVDPACGSGHFLLDAFARLVDHWHRSAPGMDPRERVQTALDCLHGVDLNPFAVAIAEFRLTVAALRAAGDTDLEHAPAYRFHLAAGDSLLHGDRQLTLEEAQKGSDADAMLSGFTYSFEDLERLRGILRPGRYDVVVTNPPYILARDAALNAAYRQRYSACSGKYQLTVPFTQRLFELAAPGGWIGQIVSNGFIKREFGRKLIEQFLVTKDLREIIDTSGAYIPGHGTPTMIMIARNKRPETHSVLSVLGLRGEPSTPADPAHALVWTSIVANVDTPGAATPYVNVMEMPRTTLNRHPWSLSGGGAIELKGSIDARAREKLRDITYRVGFFAVIGADDAMMIPTAAIARQGLEQRAFMPLVIGEDIRDYQVSPGGNAFFPYDAEHNLQDLSLFPGCARRLWPYRTELGNRATWSKRTYFEEDRPWYEWHQLPRDQGASSSAITFAEVATHNHYVLDRGGKVFNKTARVIKLPDGASEDDHLRLLGVLNSSTACFWLRQVSYNKGAGSGGSDEPWEHRYEFYATNLEQFPMPTGSPLDIARRLDSLGRELARSTPTALATVEVPTRDALAVAHNRWQSLSAQMIAFQEELDWAVYRLYGLVNEDLTYISGEVPKAKLGERAFEIVLARRVQRGEEQTGWFDKHGSTPITEVPAYWPAPYRELVERRIELIETRTDLALIERPEYKRRWATEPWEKREREALRDWLLDRLEQPALWRDRDGRAQVRSAADLAQAMARDVDFGSVFDLYLGTREYDLASQLDELLRDEAVPYLAAHRYKEPGMRTRAVWESVWDLQRRQDAGEDVGPIPVPPKYRPTDFDRVSYWHRRGKLDVPKERFIGYPAAERDGDGSPVFGWAGWDHLDQAIALASLVLVREQRDAWPAERLQPLLAGLAELEPWLAQWHHDPDPAYSGPPSAYISTQLDGWLTQYQLTRDDLRAWRPEPTRRGRGRRARATMEARN